MNNLIKEESKFKARILQKTSQGKYKAYVYSDKENKEIGIFFISDGQMKKDKIKESDINNVIQFKGKLKKIKDTFYFSEIKDINRERISYSRKERRTSLSKYDDGKYHEFTAKFNYKRENDERSLFTEVKLKPRLQIDHLNLKINEELERDKLYSFKGKIIKYEKKHTTGFFYSIENIKKVELIEGLNQEINKKIKNKEEKISITKKEYDRLKEIESTLKKLLNLID